MVGAEHNGPSEPPGDAGGLLDVGLRERVDKALADFQRCLDAAAAQPTSKNIAELRRATDALMRAGARVLIELGRM